MMLAPPRPAGFATASASRPILEVDDLVVSFAARGSGPLSLSRRSLTAVAGVSLTVAPGETLGIVGESGSGKSTLGRAILGLEAAAGGHVVFDGLDVTSGRREALKRLRRETAMVFQDPSNALNPTMTVGATLAEVLRVHGKVARGREAARVAELLSLVGLKVARGREAARVAELLSLVGLDPELAGRRPGALSGGQCQRVGIARALGVEPKLVVADECVAALDVSIQGQIVNLFLDLKETMGLTLIFIAHDLAIVRRLCDRVAVMYLGRIVEEGPTEAVFSNPRHPYTAALIAAIPEIDPDKPLPDVPVGGEPPSPLALPDGCAFHPRCAYAENPCRTGAAPILSRAAGGHGAACILPPGALGSARRPSAAFASPAA